MSQIDRNGEDSTLHGNDNWSSKRALFWLSVWDRRGGIKLTPSRPLSSEYRNEATKHYVARYDFGHDS
jgi:hypothetical protein